MTDPAVEFDQLLHFSRVPQDPSRPAERRLRFPVERDLESFVVENFGYLFEDLKFMKRQFELPGGNRIDILARHKASGDLVVIELKAAHQDRGTASQIVGYMEELEAAEQVKRNPRKIRGRVITSEPNEVLTGHLAVLAEHHHYNIEWHVCRVEMTLDLSGTERTTAGYPALGDQRQGHVFQHPQISLDALAPPGARPAPPLPLRRV